MSADRPITARELARLLRVLAGMIEAGATDDPELAPPPRRRATRRRATPSAGETTTETSDLAKARARAALRRHGYMP